MTPTRMTGLPPIPEVSVSDGHTLALARDGGIYAWGSNSHGQLGDGGLKSSDTPVRVSPVPPAESVAAGWHYSVAALADGTVRVRGSNASAKAKLAGVEAVFMAGSRCFAVASGQLYVWGFGHSRMHGVMSKHLYVPTLFVAP